MDTQCAPHFPATAQRITTRFLAGYEREDRTLIFCDGVHVLTVIGSDASVTTYATAPQSSRLTNVTGRMPNHVRSLAEAVAWWQDELGFQLEVVAI